MTNTPPPTPTPPPAPPSPEESKEQTLANMIELFEHAEFVTLTANGKRIMLGRDIVEIIIEAMKSTQGKEEGSC